MRNFVSKLFGREKKKAATRAETMRRREKEEKQAEEIERLKKDNRRLEGRVQELEGTVNGHVERITQLTNQLAKAERVCNDTEAERDIAIFKRDVYNYIHTMILLHYIDFRPNDRSDTVDHFDRPRRTLESSRNWTETSDAVQLEYSEVDRLLNHAVTTYDWHISRSRLMDDRLARSQEEARRLRQELDATRRILRVEEYTRSENDMQDRNRGRDVVWQAMGIGSAGRPFMESAFGDIDDDEDDEEEGEDENIFGELENLEDDDEDDEEEGEDESIFGEPENLEGDAVITDEFDKCTICFGEDVSNPVGCFSCKAHIGCRSCVRRWVRASPRDPSEQFNQQRSTAQCPLCRALWTRGEHYLPMWVLGNREARRNGDADI